jgi:DNA polymerase-3 subunit delta
MTRQVSVRGLRPHELRAALKKSPPAPLYFCSGEEPYLITQALELLRAATVGPDDLFNYQRFEAVDTPVAEMLTAVDTLPVFAERRLVVIARVEALAAEAQASLLAVLDTLPPTTCLAITASKIDQRRRLFAWLNQHATLINCQPLLERELPAWLNGQSAALDLQLTPDAAHALLEQAGSSLHALVNELEKLKLHARDPALPLTPPSQTHASPSAASAPVKITLEALHALTARERNRSIFELTDAVGQRRCTAALAIVRRLLEQGEQPVGITVMLTRHLRRLWLAKSARDAGASPADLARKLAVAPRYAETINRQVAGFTHAELRRAMTCCLTADAQLKGGRAPKDYVVDGLILELCGKLPGPLMVTP